MYSYSTPKALESPLKMPKEHRSFKYYIVMKGVERYTAIISQTKWPRSSLLNRKYQKHRQIPAGKGVLVYCDTKPDQGMS